MKGAFVVIVVLVVLGALGGGFYLVGPPADERARSLDARRERDLAGLRLAIDLYWTRNNRLPSTLDELAKEAGTNIYSRDPESGDSYGYVVKGDEYLRAVRRLRARSPKGASDFWSHRVQGRHCYALQRKAIRP